MQQHFRLIGTGRQLPSHRIEAEDLDRRLGLPLGTSFARTGVQTRYQALAPESGATLARSAVTAALHDARVTLASIDLIIDASLCVQQPIPCNAALLQEVLGPEAHGIPCMDVHASCLSFLAALQVANGLFASEAAQRILIVCAETPLQGVNWDEPESACLMGDAAAAVVVERCAPTSSCVFIMETHAEGAHACEVAGGGHRLSPFELTAENRGRYLFHMEGKALHKLASRLLPPLLERTLRQAGCTLQDVDVVPHQASGPALTLLGRRMDIPADRYHVSLPQHGNLVAASIPFVLHTVRKQRAAGSRILLLGTAAGYTQAAAIFHL